GIWMLGLLVLASGVAGLSVPTFLQTELGPLVPLAALQTPGITLLAFGGTLFFTFRAIFAERHSGRIRLTTGTGPSRTDVIIGVLIGRTTAVVLPVVM